MTLSNAAWARGPSSPGCAASPCTSIPFSLFLGEAKVGRVVLEGADILVEQQRGGRHQPRDAAAARRLGAACRREPLADAQANPAFPWIGTIEVRDSMLTIAEGQGRPPVVLDIASASFKSQAPNQPLQIEAQLGAPRATPLELAGTLGSFDGWMRGLPGNIDVQGGFGGGKIAIKGSIGAKGTNLQITSEGPDVAVFGPYVRLPLPSGGPYVLNAKASTQRSGFKVEVPSLKVGQSELAGEALFRVDRSGTPTITVNVDADKIDLAGLKAAPAPAPAVRRRPRAASCRRMPFTASWLGRNTLSVTARVGELSGLSSKIANGSMTLSSEREALYLPRRRLDRQRLGELRPRLRSGRPPRHDDADRQREPRADERSRRAAGLRSRAEGCRRRHRSQAARRRPQRGGGAERRQRHDRVAVGKGTWPADGLAGWPGEPVRLLNANEGGAAFNCLAGRFEVSAGVANLRRLVVDTPRATWIGGGYLRCATRAGSSSSRPRRAMPMACRWLRRLRLKGGTGRATSGALDPGLAKLLIGGGPVPSLTGS